MKRLTSAIVTIAFIFTPLEISYLQGDFKFLTGLTQCGLGMAAPAMNPSEASGSWPIKEKAQNLRTQEKVEGAAAGLATLDKDVRQAGAAAAGAIDYIKDAASLINNLNDSNPEVIIDTQNALKNFVDLDSSVLYLPKIQIVLVLAIESLVVNLSHTNDRVRTSAQGTLTVIARNYALIQAPAIQTALAQAIAPLATNLIYPNLFVIWSAQETLAAIAESDTLTQVPEIQTAFVHAMKPSVDNLSHSNSDVRYAAHDTLTAIAENNTLMQITEIAAALPEEYKASARATGAEEGAAPALNLSEANSSGAAGRTVLIIGPSEPRPALVDILLNEGYRYRNITTISPEAFGRLTTPLGKGTLVINDSGMSTPDGTLSPAVIPFSQITPEFLVKWQEKVGTAAMTVALVTDDKHSVGEEIIRQVAQDNNVSISQVRVVEVPSDGVVTSAITMQIQNAVSGANVVFVYAGQRALEAINKALAPMGSVEFTNLYGMRDKELRDAIATAL